MNERSDTIPKTFSLSLTLIFGLVGGIFLILPQEVLRFFNAISRRLGMVEGPAEPSFFVVLAVAYMYVVTILAWFMFKAPKEKIYPLLLTHAKLASAVFSFVMFAVQAPCLIYLVNGVVDAGLGLLVLAVHLRTRAGRREAGA
jgi:hypothetical protein